MYNRRNKMATAVIVLVSVVVSATVVADKRPNLLTNGGFEKDTDKNGVPDGWVSHRHHFSRESLNHVKAFIAKLSSHKKLLAGKHVLGSDGWVLARRQSNGTWGSYNKSAESLSDTTPPKQWVQYGFAFSIPSGWAASTSWEARRAGVNDFRYLQTLERAIKQAVDAGKSNLPRVVAARKYLDRLRSRVPLHAFSYRNRIAYKQFQTLAPGILAKEYDSIQETCSAHIIAIQRALP